MNHEKHENIYKPNTLRYNKQTHQFDHHNKSFKKQNENTHQENNTNNANVVQNNNTIKFSIMPNVPNTNNKANLWSSIVKKNIEKHENPVNTFMTSILETKNEENKNVIKINQEQNQEQELNTEIKKKIYKKTDENGWTTVLIGQNQK